jgi:ribosomal protein S18 acetylase RimI-like enzyme
MKIEIIDYTPDCQPWFESLNRAWIEQFFEMEKSDVEVLTRPDEMLIAKGGAILMARYDGKMAGTVALKKIGNASYEFTKMAVDERFRRKGIAEHLSYASFLKAHRMGAEKMVLFSNSLLAGAILLYEKLGFRHVPVEHSEYRRSDVKMEIDMAEAVKRAGLFFQNTSTQQQSSTK